MTLEVTSYGQLTFDSVNVMLTFMLTNSLSFISNTFIKHPTLFKCSLQLRRSASCISAMDEKNFAFTCKQLAPPLTNDKHKGQAGRIGVFGGSLEYTGAPYFAAISALKVGADLVHVFCPKNAGNVIKSYSPELIVHPLLDDVEAVKKIEPWLERLHVVLIGNGLGREPATFKVIQEIMNLCRATNKPLVIDADGLFFVAEHPEIIRDYPAPGIILTPNVMEYSRLVDAENAAVKREIPRNPGRLDFGRTVTILRKGPEDDIMDYAKRVRVSGGGSGRRCGGQGDLLAGALSTFYAWALQHKMEEDVDHDDRAMIACYAASKLTRKCNERAFAKKGRAMLCSDMIDEIGGVFKEKFEPQ